MIGTAITLLWSVTLTNINPTPQLINIGDPPNNESYRVMFAEVINNDPAHIPNMVFSMGNNINNPADIIPSFTITSNNMPNIQSGIGFFGTTVIAAASTPDYVSYSGTGASNVTIDFFGYAVPSQ